jgi:hypothetical protein
MKRHGSYGIPTNGGYIELAEFVTGESDPKTNGLCNRLNETSRDD